MIRQALGAAPAVMATSLIGHLLLTAMTRSLLV